MPRDFEPVRIALRLPDARVQLVVCATRAEHTRAFVAGPIVISPPAGRRNELRRVVEEYGRDALSELGAPREAWKPADREWTVEHAASSMSEIEKAALRLVALRTCGNISRAAARLGMARVSLARWIARRKLRVKFYRDGLGSGHASRPASLRMQHQIAPASEAARLRAASDASRAPVVIAARLARTVAPRARGVHICRGARNAASGAIRCVIDEWKDGDRGVVGAQADFLKGLNASAHDYTANVPTTQDFMGQFLVEFVNVNHKERNRSYWRSPFADPTRMDGYIELDVTLYPGSGMLIPAESAALHCPKSEKVAAQLVESIRDFDLSRTNTNIVLNITTDDLEKEQLPETWRDERNHQVELDTNHVVTNSTMKQFWDWVQDLGDHPKPASRDHLKTGH